MRINSKSICSILVAAGLGLAVLTGCAQAGSKTAASTAASTMTTVALAQGGTLLVRVNPEIAVKYDDKGLVTAVESKNDDGAKILESYKGFEGKEAKVVVNELVSAIGAAGYFVEDVDGSTRKITIEVEEGSRIPSDNFLSELAEDVRANVSQNQWKAPIEVQNDAVKDEPDYVDTDYGTDADGVTDYYDTDYGVNNDGVTNYDENDTDYGPNNDGVTDYDPNDTDYGTNNDGVTNYDANDTDYGTNNDGVTNYDANDTDYGTNNDGVTNYESSNDTDYGANNDGVTDYSSTTSNDGASNYSAPDSDDTPDDGNNDGNSNYN